MRISDWSSDVCSSDLYCQLARHHGFAWFRWKLRRCPSLPHRHRAERGPQRLQQDASPHPHASRHRARKQPLPRGGVPGWRKGGERTSPLGLLEKVDKFAELLFLFVSVTAGDRRSEESRVGKEWVSTCGSGWSPYH